MAQPSLGAFAQRVYDQLEPLKFDEPNQDWALAKFIAAFGTMYQEIDDYASDGPGGESGWSVLLDLNRAPSKALPWLAQFAGVTLDQSLSDANQRIQIQERRGMQRGSPAAIVAAAQSHLTGTKDVLVIERYQGDPYKLYIATRISQTADTTRTLNDILTQKPAGILLTYQTVTGQTFNELLVDSPLYSNVFSNYLTFQGVATGVHGT